MKKRSYVLVTTRLVIEHDDNVTVEDVIGEMDYNFEAQNDGKAEITDTEIRDFHTFNPNDN